MASIATRVSMAVQLVTSNGSKMIRVKVIAYRNAYRSGFSVVVNKHQTFFVLFLLRSPDIIITKWHMPFVRLQLMWAMEETFWKKGGVKFANINLVSN